MIYLAYNSSANLGNYLFQIGYALSLGGSSTIAFYVPDEVAESRVMRYKALYPFMMCVRDVPKDAITVNENKIDLNVFRFDGRKNYLLYGYFQYPRFLCRNRILKMLKCPRNVKEAILEKYGRIFDSYETVGVSVRRGDYLKLPHRHPFVGKKYLRRAVERFSDKCVFVVCSDDMSWCKSFFSPNEFPNRRFVFVEGESVLVQLFVHTMCRHNILSNSTFSWWGAYLNPNEPHVTIVPSTWYGIGFIGMRFDLVLEEWVVEKSSYTFPLFVHALFCIWKARIGNVLRAIGFR